MPRFFGAFFRYDEGRRTTMQVKIEIVNFVDDHFPGFVEFHLTDAHGRVHTFVDKVPIVSLEDLGPESSYPHPSTMQCTVLKTHRDADGREFAVISTDGIESTDNTTEFVVLSTQLA
jgi:hypothetical protein